MTPDTELLTRYAHQGDEEAFAELVHRHLDHVHSTALRLVGGDAHLAEDVAQTVFTDLARKADSLRNRLVLSGWLHASTRFAAAKLVRTEQRRRHREQATLAMGTNAIDSEPDWGQIRTLLDDHIARLSRADRDALLLRYFEKKPLLEIGVALGLSENAARMRVDRAVDKLRSRLAVSGITSSAAALARLMAAQVVEPAPVELGSWIVSQALVGAGSAGAGMVGTLRSLARNRRHTWLVAGALSLLTVFLVLWLQPHQPQPAPSSVAATVQPASEVTPAATANAGATVAEVARPRELALIFEDADTGRSLLSQTIGLRGWDPSTNVIFEKTVLLDDQGRCVAPFLLDHGPDFRITTHVDGYADTRLLWETRKGEVVPNSYTVRLVRPALVHGLVVDHQGRPVAGAEVGLNHDEVPGWRAGPEDHSFGYLTPTTDANGRWETRRIALEMVRYVYGSATHPEHMRSEGFWASRDGQAVAQLLEGTFVLQLREGATARGQVVNRDGQPVERAFVRVGIMGEGSSREVFVASDGSFKLTGCPPGRSLLTVLSADYAPLAVATTLTADTPPLKLTLGPGRTLRLRVVDTEGQPIARASVSLSFRATYEDYEAGRAAQPNPQMSFSEQTDTEGRLVWEQAPDQDLLFELSVPGRLGRQKETVRPDDEEHVITITLPERPKPLVFTGTVRDADTGDLLPRFRLGVGRLESLGEGPPKQRWFITDQDWPGFTGGTFRHQRNTNSTETTNFVYLLRFEAEGYAAQVKQVRASEEGAPGLDVRLHRAEGTLIAVYTPHGSVAAQAQVGLFAPGTRLRLAPGALALGTEGTGTRYASGWLRQADAQGLFLLPQDETVRRIAIAHPEGYAEIDVQELRKERGVRLAAWGVIEGYWRVDGRPVANGQLSVWRPINTGMGQPLSDGPEVGFPRFQARTDVQGFFCFPKVPPGPLELHGQPAGPRQSVRLAVLDIQPGQTNRVFVGDPEVPGDE